MVVIIGTSHGYINNNLVTLFLGVFQIISNDQTQQKSNKKTKIIIGFLRNDNEVGIRLLQKQRRFRAKKGWKQRHIHWF